MNKKNKCNYGKHNDLLIPIKGTIYPNTSTFDSSCSCYSNQAVNMNSHPMFYNDYKVNNLCTSAKMKYGNINNIGTMYTESTLKLPVLNLTIDNSGYYKFVDNYGKIYNIYDDISKRCNFIKIKNKKMYFKFGNFK